MDQIDEKTGLPILDTPRPPPGVEPAKLEAWISETGGLQLLMTYQEGQENELPGLLIKLAHAAITKLLDPHMGSPYKTMHGVAKESL